MKEQGFDAEAGRFSRSDLDRMSVNAIRFLSVDVVQKANSGHPGMPLGAVPLGWLPYFGPHLAGVIGVDHFGASAPGDVVLREYGFNLDNVVRKVHEALQASKTRLKPVVKELKR